MTGPPGSANRQQDLMLPLGPLADDAGRDVILSEEHADAVLNYCRAMGGKFGAPSYIRWFYGLPVHEALLAGYQITQRALRETTPHACAQEIARTALGILRDSGAGRDGEAPRVLDLFAGAGQVTYSYAQAGCRVQATDNDRPTAGVGEHNVGRAGLAGRAGYRLADGPATLASAPAGQDLSIVHLDPPWRGAYKYDLNRPFLLEDLAVDVPELVRLGLERAPLVVLNLPHNALPSQISELASAAGCRALIEYLFISDFPASFSQAPAFFYGPPGPSAGCEQRHQKLTLDGERVA